MESGIQTDLPLDNRPKIEIAAGVLGSLSLTVIYVSFLKPILRQFMAKIGQYIFYPLYAIAKLVEVILAWRDYALNKQPGKLTYALVETLTAAAMLAVTLGGFIASTAFTLATPIVYATIGAVKTIYHASKILYHGISACMTKDEKQKAEHKNAAKLSMISTMGSALATVGTVLFFIFEKAFLGTVGLGINIAVTIFTAGYALFRGVKGWRDKKKRTHPLSQAQEKHADMHQPSGQDTLSIFKKLNCDLKNDGGQRYLPSERCLSSQRKLGPRSQISLDPSLRWDDKHRSEGNSDDKHRQHNPYSDYSALDEGSASATFST